MLIATVTGTRCAPPPLSPLDKRTIQPNHTTYSAAGDILSTFALPMNRMLNKLNSLSLYLIISVTFAHYQKEKEHAKAKIVYHNVDLV
jgi:hypothetical protein